MKQKYVYLVAVIETADELISFSLIGSDFIFCIALSANRHILILYDRISSRYFIKQHFIVFFTVIIQSVLCHRN